MIIRYLVFCVLLMLLSSCGMPRSTVIDGIPIQSKDVPELDYFDTICWQLQVRNYLYCSSKGLMAKNGDVTYHFNFVTRNLYDLSEARLVTLELVEDLWRMMLDNQNMGPKMKQIALTNPEVLRDRFVIFIHCIDRKGNYVKPLKIALCGFADGKFNYSIIDKASQQQQMVYSETYAEACAFRDSQRKS